MLYLTKWGIVDLQELLDLINNEEDPEIRAEMGAMFDYIVSIR